MISNAILTLLLVLFAVGVVLPLLFRVKDAIVTAVQGSERRHRRLSLSAARGR